MTQQTEANPQQSSQDESQKQQDAMKLTDVLDHVVEETEEEDKVTLKELMESFGSRAYGPLLLIPALLAVFPLTGGVPGMSLVTGSMILLISVQMIIFHSGPWLPDQLLQFSFSRDKLAKTSDKVKPWLRPIESVIHSRWTVLTEKPGYYLLAAVCSVMALLFYPGALIPLAVMIPGAAILLLALGLTARDGLLVLLGYLLSAVSTGLVIYYWPF